MVRVICINVRRQYGSVGHTFWCDFREVNVDKPKSFVMICEADFLLPIVGKIYDFDDTAYFENFSKKIHLGT